MELYPWKSVLLAQNAFKGRVGKHCCLGHVRVKSIVCLHPLSHYTCLHSRWTVLLCEVYIVCVMISLLVKMSWPLHLSVGDCIVNASTLKTIL